MHQGVDTGVENEIDTASRGGLANGRQANRLFLRPAQRSRRMIGVLEVEAHGAREAEDVHAPACDQIAFTGLLRTGAFERHVRAMRTRYRARRDALVAMLTARAPSVTPVGISAGLRVLLELHPMALRQQRSWRRRRAARSRCSRSHRPTTTASRRATASSSATGHFPEHAFASALDALGDLLESQLLAGSVERDSLRP